MKLKKKYKTILQRDQEKIGFIEKVEKFKEKYSTNNTSYWSGKPIKDLFKSVYWTEEHRNILYKMHYRIYAMYSNYTHSSMPYELIDSNPYPLITCYDETAIEILFFSNMFYELLLESNANYYSITDKNITKYIEAFSSVQKEYNMF